MTYEFNILSTDGQTPLRGIIWKTNSKEKPKAILQIVHGMAEHIERYNPTANILNENHIMVIGHDHLGHGQSLHSSHPIQGYFGKGHHTPGLLIEDTYQITKYIQEHYPGIPIFIMGHSMGSFVLRNYLKKYSHHVAGSILMGTSARREEASIVHTITKGLNKLSPKITNPAIDKLLFGSFNQGIKNPKSNFSWLSKNQENVVRYEEDTNCGFIFTNNGFFTLISLMDRATQKNWYQTIRRDLPVLIISGEKDPVGSYGKGPRKTALELTDHGFSDITLQLYYDLRHEILNEVEYKEIVLDIYDWMTHHLSK